MTLNYGCLRQGRDTEVTYKNNAGCNCRKPNQASREEISASLQIKIITPKFSDK